jgi:hypothetical protein
LQKQQKGAQTLFRPRNFRDLCHADIEFPWTASFPPELRRH